MAVHEQMWNPWDKCDYEVVAENVVKVTHRPTGISGLFDYQGRWLSGERRQVDRKMLVVLAQPRRGMRVKGM